MAYVAKNGYEQLKKLRHLGPAFKYERYGGMVLVRKLLQVVQ